jgi:GH18 family chitinase
MNPLFEVGAYIQMQGERVMQPLGLLPLEGLDHVSYAFGSVDDSGAAVRTVKGEPVPASIVFEASVLNQIDTPAKLSRFLTSLEGVSEVTFLVQLPLPQKFNEVCAQISNQMPLKFALPGNVDELEQIGLSAYDSHVVSYDLLGYDYHTPQEGRATNFHTLLSDREGPCIAKTLAFLEKNGIDLKKVNLGLASYGKLYRQVPPGPKGNGLGQEAQGPQLSNPNLSYNQIEEYILAHPAAKVYYTSLDGVLQSFIYNTANGDWIACDDPDTLKGKVQWAEERGLRGVFLWSSDQDNPTFSELKAVEKGHRRKNWTKI